MPSDSIPLVLSKDRFFSTIQGEGPRTGRPTTFMRLGGCNLTCSWCDTAYTWDWTRFSSRTELMPTPIEKVAKYITNNLISSLTITGGEPFLQARALQDLFLYLKASRHFLDEVNFETNGTIWPEWTRDTWGVVRKWGIVISPKLQNSGNSVLAGPDEAVQERIETLVQWLVLEEKLFNMQIDFKFVCEGPQDFNEIAELRALVGASDHAILASRVWIMPQGTDPKVINAKAQGMVDEIIHRGWSLTTRLHQNLWGDARAK